MIGQLIDPKSTIAATSKMESFVIIVNGWKPLTIITKCSILDVEAALDPPLVTLFIKFPFNSKKEQKFYKADLSHYEKLL